MTKRITVFVVITCMALAVAFLAGCGDADKKAGASTSPSSQPEARTEPSSAPDAEALSKHVVGASKMSDEELSAAEEALHCAQDANTGSSFKAMSVRCVDGWATVSVEETGVPADEVIGFGVYLKRGEDGGWEVIQTGTGLTTDDIPGAPEELFAD